VGLSINISNLASLSLKLKLGYSTYGLVYEFNDATKLTRLNYVLGCPSDFRYFGLYFPRCKII
jgi:hypothetical protein